MYSIDVLMNSDNYKRHACAPPLPRSDPAGPFPPSDLPGRSCAARTAGPLKELRLQAASSAVILELKCTTLTLQVAERHGAECMIGAPRR